MTKTISISEFPLWERAKKKRTLLQLTLEITARCNNNCIHCYNNLPANDINAAENELSTEQIKNIIDQAVELGVLWVLITGGEALLREDFFEIYKYIKKQGLIVSLFTNATLVSDDHIKMFRKYPPRDIEVTVYGLSRTKYAKVTRTKNYSFFMNGFEKLLKASLPVSLKATIMKSNAAYLREIIDFCRNKSYKNFRFDPFLFLRTDKNKKRNQDIINQRLSIEEIIALEQEDFLRMKAVRIQCRKINTQKNINDNLNKLFKCGAGLSSCMVDCNGFFRLCSSLVNPQCIYDLKKGSLKQAWKDFAPMILNQKTPKKEYQDTCGKCKLMDLCAWCPAKSDLETNILDGYSQYFCSIAHERYDLCINKN